MLPYFNKLLHPDTCSVVVSTWTKIEEVRTLTCNAVFWQHCTLFLSLALEKKNGRGENNICLEYIRSVQLLFNEVDKVT